MAMRTIQSRAPMRLGFAGGGTDVSSYSNKFGGLVLNATISLYAYCTVSKRNDGRVFLEALDLGLVRDIPMQSVIAVDHSLALIAQCYNRIVADFCLGKPFAITISTRSDVPPGSGLGASSTMVVAIVSALTKAININLNKIELARIAFRIEREDLRFSGGKQDQYAAAFGGFNIMEFSKNGHTRVTPLNLSPSTVSNLESHLLLYYTGASRDSARIIDAQIHNVELGDDKSIDALHQLKHQTVRMKHALLSEDLSAVGATLRDGWHAKRKTAACISNDSIEEIISTVQAAGAYGAKISGAGGGGFLIISMPPPRRDSVISSLNRFPGSVYNCIFTEVGVQSWTVH